MAHALSPERMSESWIKRGEAIAQQPPVHFLEGQGRGLQRSPLPWIGAALTLGLWLLGRFGVSWTVGDLPLMLFGLIFIDGVHVIFTFVLA